MRNDPVIPFFSRRRRALRVLAVALLPALPCAAQSRANGTAAQVLFDQAKKLMAEGRAAEACPKFEESQRLDPGGGTLLNLARCYEQTARLSSAWNAYLEAAAAAKASGNAQREKEAKKRADALKAKLTNLLIVVSPEAQAAQGLEVSRDGQPVGAAQWGVAIPADAGEHSVTASAPGHAPWQSSVTLKGEGTTTTVIVPALTKEAPPAPPIAAPVLAPAAPAGSDTRAGTGLGTQRTLALVAGGIGVVGVGIGTVFGLKSMSRHDEAEKYCNGADCTDARGVTAGNDAYAAGNVATVGMIVGAAGIAGGLALWFTAKRTEPGPAAALSVGPGAIGVEGTW